MFEKKTKFGRAGLWTVLAGAGAVAIAGTLLGGADRSAPLLMPAAQAQGTAAGPAIGKKAPAFTVATMGGGKLDPTKQTGKVVVMDFWATWCPPCRMAIPVLQEMHKKYGKQGVVVVGISDEDKATVNPFVKKQNMTYTVIADPKGAQEGMRRYRADSIPTLAVIDKKGTLRMIEVGFNDDPKEGTRAKLNQILPKLLAEK